jgi:predicted ATPase
MRRHAPREAAQYLRRADTLLARSHASRSAEALETLVELGGALIGAEGFGSDAVARTYRRAYALCERRSNLPRSIPVLCGLWNYYLTRADFRSVDALAQKLAAAIKNASDVDRFAAHNALGQTHLFKGEPDLALPHIAAVLEGYSAARHADLAAHYGEDPGVVCHHYAALTAWLIGDAAKARDHLARGTRIARELGQPGSIAQMLWISAVIEQLHGDAAQVLKLAIELAAHCEQHDVAQWLAGGVVFEGWALAVTGHPQDGLRILQRGIDQWLTGGTRLIRPYWLALLADAHAAHGETHTALALVDTALRECEETGERWYLSALHQLKRAWLAKANDARAS